MSKAQGGVEEALWTDAAKGDFRGLYRSDPGVARLQYFIYDLQDFATNTLGLSYKLTRPISDQLKSWIDALDRQVVAAKNARP